MVEIAKEVTVGIQKKLENRISKHNELVNKCVQIEKEGVKIKKSTKNKMISYKKIIDSLKKENDSLRKKLDNEKKKNWLGEFDIKEGKNIQAQYIEQLEEERSARNAAKSDMQDYEGPSMQKNSSW